MWSATFLLMWHSQSPRMVAEGALPQFVTVPIDQFPLKWRFTDPRYDVLPAIHLTSHRRIQSTPHNWLRHTRSFFALGNHHWRLDRNRHPG